MEFEAFEPVYAAILADFGFDRAADERARDLLATLVSGDDAGAGGRDAPERRAAPTLAPEDLDFTGEAVAIAGAGPSLAPDDPAIEGADSVIAASDAGAVLGDAGVAIDCLVTDLDEKRPLAREYTSARTPVAVHAHGDNQDALREQVPEMAVESVLPTTQAAPVGPVHNVGGFTDGDRAAFLADHCGAAELTFAGWDFDDPDVDPLKRRKLRWAERLLRWLERRRGERFSVLDGRRDGIDESMMPVG